MAAAAGRAARSRVRALGLGRPGLARGVVAALALACLLPRAGAQFAFKMMQLPGCDRAYCTAQFNPICDTAEGIDYSNACFARCGSPAWPSSAARLVDLDPLLQQRFKQGKCEGLGVVPRQPKSLPPLMEPFDGAVPKQARTTCPIDMASVDYAPLAPPCAGPSGSVDVCQGCACAILETFAFEARRAGMDVDELTTEDLMSIGESCALAGLQPMRDVGVTLTTLLGIPRCQYDTPDGFPTCSGSVRGGGSNAGEEAVMGTVQIVPQVSALDEAPSYPSTAPQEAPTSPQEAPTSPQEAPTAPQEASEPAPRIPGPMPAAATSTRPYWVTGGGGGGSPPSSPRPYWVTGGGVSSFSRSSPSLRPYWVTPVPSSPFEVDGGGAVPSGAVLVDVGDSAAAQEKGLVLLGFALRWKEGMKEIKEMWGSPLAPPPSIGSPSPEAEEAFVSQESPEAEGAFVSQESPEAEGAFVSQESPEAEGAFVSQESPEAEGAFVSQESPEAEGAFVSQESPEAEGAFVSQESPEAEGAFVSQESPEAEGAFVSHESPASPSGGTIIASPGSSGFTTDVGGTASPRSGSDPAEGRGIVPPSDASPLIAVGGDISAPLTPAETLAAPPLPAVDEDSSPFEGEEALGPAATEDDGPAGEEEEEYVEPRGRPDLEDFEELRGETEDDEAPRPAVPSLTEAPAFGDLVASIEGEGPSSALAPPFPIAPLTAEGAIAPNAANDEDIADLANAMFPDGEPQVTAQDAPSSPEEVAARPSTEGAVPTPEPCVRCVATPPQLERVPGDPRWAANSTSAPVSSSEGEEPASAPGEEADSPPACPVKMEELDMSSLVGPCSGDDMSSSSAPGCDECICAMSRVFAPALVAAGLDIAGEEAAAEALEPDSPLAALLQVCTADALIPMAAAGVDINALMSLAACDQEAAAASFAGCAGAAPGVPATAPTYIDATGQDPDLEAGGQAAALQLDPEAAGQILDLLEAGQAVDLEAVGQDLDLLEAAEELDLKAAPEEEEASSQDPADAAGPEQQAAGQILDLRTFPEEKGEEVGAVEPATETRTIEMVSSTGPSVGLPPPDLDRNAVGQTPLDPDLKAAGQDPEAEVAGQTPPPAGQAVDLKAVGQDLDLLEAAEDLDLKAPAPGQGGDPDPGASGQAMDLGADSVAASEEGSDLPERMPIASGDSPLWGEREAAGPEEPEVAAPQPSNEPRSGVPFLDLGITDGADVPPGRRLGPANATASAAAAGEDAAWRLFVAMFAAVVAALLP